MKWCHMFPKAGAPPKANRISQGLQAGAVSCAFEAGGDIGIEFGRISLTPMSPGWSGQGAARGKNYQVTWFARG